jgi:hypothetical protein
MTKTAKPEPGPRRAAIIGLGLDGRGTPHRIITGQECLVLGGSEQTHADILETMLRLEVELERIGQRLGDLPPGELAEIAWRIDSPELQEIALRIESGLERLGRTFDESSAAELTALATGRAG